MDSNPVDQIICAPVMKQTRLRRKLFFSTILAYIPALCIINSISPTSRAMGTFFAVWLVILIVTTTLAALCRCPRCGNYFHLHGMTFLPIRKCLHCQLHITESMQGAQKEKGHF